MTIYVCLFDSGDGCTEPEAVYQTVEEACTWHAERNFAEDAIVYAYELGRRYEGTGVDAPACICDGRGWARQGTVRGDEQE